MKKITFLSLWLILSTSAFAADDFPEDWLTVAEKSDFRATSSYDETMTFLRKAEAAAPQLIRVTDFGRSAQGRPLPLVIVSADGIFTPEAAAATGKPILLMQSCIHAGEVDGKDATLMILRDLALGRRPDLTKDVIILFAPIYNADGHERVSPYNRSNQNGPVEGMGYRATADGINLNRDFLRLTSPEARAMAGLVARWNPDLHVDNHVTNGSDHAWVLTWLVAEAPQLDPAVDAWVATHLPKVLAATAATGHPNGPYVNLVSRTNPAAGMLWDVAQPRYSSGYFPLRNRPSILIEMHAHKPFRDRVYANRAFMEELIGEVGRSGKELVRAVTAADAATISRGRADAEPSEVVVRWGVAEEGDTLTWPAYEWTVEDSVALGGKQILYHPAEIREVDLEWRHTPVPELTLPRPRGYIVLAGWPQIEEVVTGHGLRAYRIEKVAELEVETIRLSSRISRPADRPSAGQFLPGACGFPPTSRISKLRSSSSSPRPPTLWCGGGRYRVSSSARSTSAPMFSKSSRSRCWQTKRSGRNGTPPWTTPTLPRTAAPATCGGTGARPTGTRPSA